MDYKFLNKVVNQIVSETRVDYDRKVIFTPFSLPFYLPSLTFIFSISSSYRSNFLKHCVEVYGLNEQEIEYVWKVYSDDIVYKIKEEKYR